MKQILESAPPGVLEALGIINEETESRYPTSVSDFEALDGNFVEVSREAENSNKPFEDEREESGIQISDGQEMEHAPSTKLNPNVLPDAQQAKLNAMSQALLDKISEGPSSIIDQDVISQLQRIRPNAEIKLREMFFSPRQAFKALTAQAKETTAKAEVKNAVAEAALSIAEIAKQDLERKVFEIFIEQLEVTEGPNIDVYCEQHNNGVVPEEGDMQRKVVLLRMHSANLALSQYKIALQKEQKKYVETRANMEGSIAMSNMKGDMLPSLIEARRVEYPLQQQAYYQKLSHRTAIAVGTPVSIVTGAAVGVVGAIYFSAEQSWKSIGEKVKGIKLPRIHIKNPFKN